MSIEDFLNQVSGDGEGLTYSALSVLSGLSSRDRMEFKIGWPGISLEIRRSVITKLIELGDDNLGLDFTAVFIIGIDDYDDDVREQAAKGLWECEDRSIVRPLLDLVKNDPSPNVRAVACTTLGRFTAMFQDGKLNIRDEERIRSILIDVIDRPGEELEVRRRAIESLGRLSSYEVEDIIRDAYDSEIPELKQSSIYAMGQSSNAMWLPIIYQEMETDEPSIRYEAVTAAGLLGDETTVPYLISILDDYEIGVLLAVISSLGLIGGELAGRALRKCLGSGDDAIEEAVNEALQQIEFYNDPIGTTFEV